MVQRIKSQYQNRFLFHDHGEQEIDGMILINGCLRACSIHELPSLKFSSYSVTGESDFQNLIEYLLSLDEKGEGR